VCGAELGRGEQQGRMLSWCSQCCPDPTGSRYPAMTWGADATRRLKCFRHFNNPPRLASSSQQCLTYYPVYPRLSPATTCSATSPALPLRSPILEAQPFSAASTPVSACTRPYAGLLSYNIYRLSIIFYTQPTKTIL
jgi:hypothetical protein